MAWQEREPDEALRPLLAAREAGDLDVLLAALHGDPATIPAAARMLAHAGERRAVPELVGLLDSDRPAVRLAAVRALGQLGAPLHARTRITEIALGDPLPSAREWACSAVAGYGDPDAAQLLIGLLGDRERIVRLGAARALSDLGRPELRGPIAAAAPRVWREPGRWLLDHRAYARFLRRLPAEPASGQALAP